MDLTSFYTPTPKQLQIHNDPHRIIGIGGGVGGGKSQAICMDAFICAITNPGNNQVLGRKFLRHLKETTLVTWKKIIPGELYYINEQKNT